MSKKAARPAPKAEPGYGVTLGRYSKKAAQAVERDFAKFLRLRKKRVLANVGIEAPTIKEDDHDEA